jgi:biotin transport system substrate-specific component
MGNRAERENPGRRASWRRILLAVVGTLTCYALGTVWFAAVSSELTLASLGAAAVGCVLPFLLPDAAKMALAALVCRRVEPPLSRLL